MESSNQKPKISRRDFLVDAGLSAAFAIYLGGFLYIRYVHEKWGGKARLDEEYPIPMRTLFGEGEEGDLLYHEVMVLGELGIRVRNEKKYSKWLRPPCEWILENISRFQGFEMPEFKANLSKEDRETQLLLAAYKYLFNREAAELQSRGLPFLMPLDHERFLTHECYTRTHLRELNHRRPGHLDEFIEAAVRNSMANPFLDGLWKDDSQGIYAEIKGVLMEDLGITDHSGPCMIGRENISILPNFVADAIADRILDHLEKNRVINPENIAFFRARKELLEEGCPLRGPRFEELKKRVLENEKMGIKLKYTAFPQKPVSENCDMKRSLRDIANDAILFAQGFFSSK